MPDSAVVRVPGLLVPVCNDTSGTVHFAPLTERVPDLRLVVFWALCGGGHDGREYPGEVSCRSCLRIAVCRVCRVQATHRVHVDYRRHALVCTGHRDALEPTDA